MNVAEVVSRLDGWLESMRGESGYGGPIAHWWESNFLFTGPLYDWRYEGIIDGYRELFVRTGQLVFLERAKRAADDVVGHQLEDGRFRNSSFQFGPVAGGTPHEAAVDVALLKLARTLEATAPGGGTRYLQAARSNIEQYWIGVLWDGKGFRDQPYNDVLVANKHGTMLEALMEFAALTGEDVVQYAEACVEVIIDAQMATGPQAGGTVHRGIGPSRLAIPIYTARAMNGLLSYFEATRDSRAVDPIVRASGFLKRMLGARGVSWGVYGSGRLCAYPEVIAGAGDLLRFFVRSGGLGIVDAQNPVARITSTIGSAQTPGGGIPTGFGFASKGLSTAPRAPCLRDVVPVVGWVDKAFRALTLLLEDADVNRYDPSAYETEARWRGKRVVFQETPTAMTVRTSKGHRLYEWKKGEDAPAIYGL